MAVDYFELTTASSEQGVDLISQIASSITGLANHWSVEQAEYTGQSSYTRTVLKCASTGSGLTDDFYVVLFTSTTGTNAWFTICEDYNTSTNTLSGYPLLQHTTDSLCRANYSSSTVTYSTLTNLNTASAVAASWISVTASNLVGLFVYEDGLAVVPRKTDGTAEFGLYVGAFTSLVTNPSTNDPVCLAVVGQRNNHGSSKGLVRFTRWAMNPSKTGFTSSNNTYIPTRTGEIYPQAIHPMSTLSTSFAGAGNTDPYTGNTGFMTAPAIIVNTTMLAGTTNLAELKNDPSAGVHRGVLKNVLLGPLANWGDTLTIGNEVYQYGGAITSSFDMWFLKEITT